MSSEKIKKTGTLTFVVTIVFLAIISTYALFFKLWFLIAIPVGFLFGFFLQKGDLCGSSAFSEVILFKDRSKVFGLWVAIIVSMGGIVLLDIFHLVSLNPKPFLWANYIVGGIIFGIGMVLAGGCVSGCLYKAGSGNINSMAALVGIPIGIATVEYGPLHSTFLTLKKIVIPNSNGGPVSLPTLTGLPFWILALIFILSTIIIVLLRKNKTVVTEKENNSLLFKAWKPWMSGIAIGLLVVPAYLSSVESGRNYPLGVTHGVLHVQLLATDNNLNHIWQKQTKPNAVIQKNNEEVTSVSTPKPVGKKVSWWLILLVSSLVAGSWTSARISNKAKLLPKPPEQTVIAFFGGIMVGIGAAIATGCVIGNILSGWALMSVGLLVFGIVTILANWITTYFYLMDGSMIFKNKKN